MTDDLSALPEDVRDALWHIRPAARARFQMKSWETIRAELLKYLRERDEARAELASAARLHRQLLDTLGANDQADAMRIIAQHHTHELAQQEPPK